MHVPRWYCCKNERCTAAINLAADVYTKFFLKSASNFRHY